MKRTTLLTAMLACMAVGGNAQKIVIEKVEGNPVKMARNVYFSQKGEEDKWSVATSETSSYISSMDLEKIASIYMASQLDLDLADYVAPSHVDYYVANAGWNTRTAWNLANVHDPSVMLAEDGYYYMYQTDAGYGNPQVGHGHFFCRRSKDLVNWTFLGATMQKLPEWIPEKLNEIRAEMGLQASTIDFTDETQFGFWAPCVRKVSDGLYRMYYVVTLPGTINGTGTWSERCFIGLMETATPQSVSSWVDKGYVITNYSDKGLNFNVNATDWANCYFKYNAIDPSYIITPEGAHWLVYGSWHSGFAAVQINPETGLPATELGNPWGTANEAAYGKRVATRNKLSRWQGSEAPEVVYRNGYYYMFMAYDELAVAYNTRVVRSENIDGPYYGINGTNVTTNGGEAFPLVTHPYKFTGDYGWVGISHCAVFDDGQDNWFFSSQGRFPEGANNNDYSNALMMGQVRSIRWTDDGWPIVMPERYGAVPQAEIYDEDIVGTWEHISMTYEYQQQSESQRMVLGEDHTVKSGWAKGQEWSLDAENRTLTIGDKKMYLQHEVDWEANPRRATIVYAGYDTYKTAATQRTFWGKKVSEATEEKLDTIGNTNCSAAWWTAFSDYYTIPANKSLTLRFINHTSGAQNYNNWNICIANNADREDSGYQEYCLLRSDRYGWGDSYSSGTWTSSGYDNWTDFRKNMEGAEVHLTITRNGEKVTMAAVAICPNGKVYRETFTTTCGDGTQTIRAFLVCDASWLEIIKE